MAFLVFLQQLIRQKLVMSNFLLNKSITILLLTILALSGCSSMKLNQAIVEKEAAPNEFSVDLTDHFLTKGKKIESTNFGGGSLYLVRGVLTDGRVLLVFLPNNKGKGAGFIQSKYEKELDFCKNSCQENNPSNLILLKQPFLVTEKITPPLADHEVLFFFGRSYSFPTTIKSAAEKGYSGKEALFLRFDPDSSDLQISINRHVVAADVDWNSISRDKESIYFKLQDYLSWKERNALTSNLMRMGYPFTFLFDVLTFPVQFLLILDGIRRR